MKTFLFSPRLRWLAVGVAASAIVVLLALRLPQQAVATAWAGRPFQGDVYRLVGWNDLGMHCMDEGYDVFSILPPYNNLWAQVLRLPAGGGPSQVITAGLTVEYSFVDNSYSAGKTNFWDNVYALFGVNLPPNVGLAGKGLSGAMDAATDHFIAAGVPLTPYNDSTPLVRQPYQLAHLVAKDTGTGQVLAETTIVVPVSDEMRCANCHSDGQREGIATGNVRRNILTLHDREEDTSLMSSQPVLCADCHATNALGLPGAPDVPNFSQAMHKRHAEATNDCYQCHPGQQTACLRDIMSASGMWCTNCHGNMLAVASELRNPWLTEPQCATCHGSQYAENSGRLYRMSVGHGGLYCEACHNSTHAILPSQQSRDNLQTIALQGYADTLRECAVCHGANIPAGNGPHNLPHPPQPVSGVTAAASGNGVVLSWLAVTQTIDGQPISGVTYNLYRSVNDPYFTRATTVYTTTGALTYTDAGVIGDPSQNYSYQVRAIYSGGVKSGVLHRVGEFDFGVAPGAP